MTSVQMAGHPLAEGGSQHPCWPAGQLPLVSVLHPVNVTAVSRLRTCEGYRVRVMSAEIPLTSPEVTTLSRHSVVGMEHLSCTESRDVGRQAGRPRHPLEEGRACQLL